MSRLLLPFADQHVEIPSLSAGNIALTVGLRQVQFSYMNSVVSPSKALICCVILGLVLVLEMAVKLLLGIKGNYGPYFKKKKFSLV